MTRCLLIFLIFYLQQSSAQSTYNIFTTQQPVHARIGLLLQFNEAIKGSAPARAKLVEGLAAMGLQPLSESPPADSFASGGPVTLLIGNSDGSEYLGVYDYRDENTPVRRAVGKWTGTYSGTESMYHYNYLKFGGAGAAVRFTYIKGNEVVLYHRALGSSGDELEGKTPGAASIAHYEAANRRMDSLVQVLYSATVPERYQAYALGADGALTATQRLFGLMMFWNAVDQNFAYFDQVPKLDWENTLLNYIPLVSAPQSDAAYYRTLERLCALLQDGHTNVYPPATVRGQYDQPAVGLEHIGGRPVITAIDSSLLDRIPLGSEIVRLGSIGVDDYLADSIYPYIAAGSEHVRRMSAIRELLVGTPGSQVSVEIRTPKGKPVNVTLTRDMSQRDVAWAKPPAEDWVPASFTRADDGIGYLAIHTFDDASVVDSFQRYREELADCEGLVIDLRRNGGGNSAYGYSILKYLMQEPALTSAWRTRESRAAFRAWGQYFIEQPEIDSSEFMDRAIKTYQDDFWYYGDPDTIRPADTTYNIPVVVLVSNNTASAAEDFLVAADALPNFTFVGEPSYGSTGQPLAVFLPGGGSARVCTKRDTYASGKEFVGPGVQVDVAIAPTVADYLAGRDVVLERALALLRQ